MYGLALIRRMATIALVAMCLAALVPTFSRLLASAEGTASLLERCATPGVTADDQASLALPDPAAPTIHSDHCPYCHIELSKCLPPAPWVFVLARATAFFPALFYQSPRPLHAWTSLPARAPPAALSLV
jgi:Protein of unknown function (DUF2946)